MTARRKLNLARASAFGFIAFLIALVVIANRGEGTQWWSFIDEVPYGDKLGHIGLFGTLSFLCNLAFPSRSLGRGSFLITSTTLVLLIIISLEELSQAFVPARTMDPLDWLADLIGLALGQLAATALKPLPKSPLKVEPQNLKFMKKALITGVTGQDGSYLAELLLEKGYEVHGIKRRASLFNTQRVDHIYEDPHVEHSRFKLHYGDLTDSSNLTRIISEIQPDEVYNLGAQSHVAVSFEAPEYTADVDAMGALRLLEAIRFLRLEKKTRFYQASTSELYGLVQEIPQKETTPFYPRSPYAVAKMYAYWITVNYRESYGMYACNGILFNHESPRRGETFVTRKITRAMANIAQGLEACLFLGNMDALRDWGHAKDYVRMQWMMLQQDAPDDFVIATGKQISVREFVRMSAKEAGITLEFSGTGVDEIATVTAVDNSIAPALKSGDIIVRVDPRYFRPAEVETLLGDPTKAKEKLGWVPEITVEEMCAEMVASDLNTARQNAILKSHGHHIPVSKE